MLSASLRSLGYSVVLALVALTNSVVTARALGLEGRGILAGATLIIGLSRGLGQLGLGEAFSLYVRRHDLARPAAVVTWAFPLTILAGSVASGALVAAIPFQWATQLILFTIFTAGLASSLDFHTNAFRIQPSLRAYNVFRISHPTLWLLLTCSTWLIADSLTPTTVVACGLTSAAVVNAFAAYRLRSMTRRIQASSTPKITSMAFLRGAIGFYGVGLIALLINNFDMLVAMMRGSVGAFSIYAVAYGLSRLAVPIPQAIGNALYAATAGSRVGERNAGSDLPLAVVRLLSIPLLTLAALATSTSPFLIPLILGPDFSAATVPFSVLLLEGIVGGLAFILAQHFQATGQQAAIFRRNLISLTPLVTLAWFIPDDRLAIGLATLMLSGALLRFAFTMILLIRNDPPMAKHWLPSREDIDQVRLQSR